MKKNIITYIIVAIIFAGIGAFASTTITAEQVIYHEDNTVKAKLDDLYTKTKPLYTGPTAITPSTTSQVLSTKDTILTEDITIDAAPSSDVEIDLAYGGAYTTAASNTRITVTNAKIGYVYYITFSTFNSWQILNPGITGAEIIKQNRFNMGTSGQGTGTHLMSVCIRATSTTIDIYPTSTHPSDSHYFSYIGVSIM